MYGPYTVYRHQTTTYFCQVDQTLFLSHQQTVMKWQVRILVVAMTASVTLILQGYLSIYPTTTCTIQKETESQYHVAPKQTLWVPPSGEGDNLQQENHPRNGVNRQLQEHYRRSDQTVNNFLSPYHKYYPVNCSALFEGDESTVNYIHGKLVHQRNLNGGSFTVPSDSEVRHFYSSPMP